MRFLPSSMRATLRSALATAPLLKEPDLDAVWTQVDLPLLPWMLAPRWRGAPPVIYSADSTPRQLRGFRELYSWWGGRSELKARFRDRLHAAFLRRASLILPLTRWAAVSMVEDYGANPGRVRVLPPAVDTSFWTPVYNHRAGSMRAIFVGGDFLRKGGDLLLRVYRESFRDRLELDVVTRTDINSEPGIKVHPDIRANDERLRDLYRRADFLVVPTRADCFSIAGLEAMSCGLPVVTCPVGGVAELLEDGRQGIFVPVDDGRTLAEAIDVLISDPFRRRAMGAAGRALAESRYDAHRNAQMLLSMIEELLDAA